MVDMEFITPWIQKAENDLFAACHLAENTHPVPTEIVCFHCQHAAEKILKAYLAYNNYEPPKIHDLSELVKLCNKFDSDFSALSLQCDFLLPFAIRARYPSGSDPEEKDMEIALVYAKKIMELVKAKIQG